MKKNYVLLLFILSVSLIQGQTIMTVAGTGSSGFSGDGQLATTAKLNLPFNITFDKSDNIFIADTYNNSIRKIDSESGIITTILGTADKKEISELKTPTGLTFDNYNNLFIADLANLRIRKINLDSGKTMTLVGQKSETEVPNIEASLGGPFNVVFDNVGNLFVSINGDSKVSKVDFRTGLISTVAGTGQAGFSGDGGSAKDATLSNPTGLVLDGKGNLYISDSGNERIRKVDLNSGIISTIAGTGENGFTKDGNLALNTKLSNPLGLAIDTAGDLFIVDRGNNRVLKLNMATNILSTVAGTGNEGFSGDGDLARNATLSNPTGLAFNKSGDLFVVDRGNNRIRKISGLNAGQDELSLASNVLVFPNPATDKVNLELKNDLDLENVTMFDIRGKEVKISLTNNVINVARLPRGIYIVRIATSKGNVEQKIVLE